MKFWKLLTVMPCVAVCFNNVPSVEIKKKEYKSEEIAIKEELPKEKTDKIINFDYVDYYTELHIITLRSVIMALLFKDAVYYLRIRDRDSNALVFLLPFVIGGVVTKIWNEARGDGFFKIIED